MKLKSCQVRSPYCLLLLSGLWNTESVLGSEVSCEYEHLLSQVTNSLQLELMLICGIIIFLIKLFKQYTHNIAMTLYKINPLRIEKIPLTIKNYPWPCGSKHNLAKTDRVHHTQIVLKVQYFVLLNTL